MVRAVLEPVAPGVTGPTVLGMAAPVVLRTAGPPALEATMPKDPCPRVADPSSPSSPSTFEPVDHHRRAPAVDPLGAARAGRLRARAAGSTMGAPDTGVCLRYPILVLSGRVN